jgi:hypothetical protein
MHDKAGVKVSKNLLYVIFAATALLNTVDANPVLTIGVWKDITPAAAGTSAQGFLALGIDHSNPSTIYAGSCGQGIWKTTNAGDSWTQLGNSSQLGTNYSKTTTYIDNPVFIDVDPNNSNHLYSCHTGWCGSGQTIGFWVSTDAGVNWNMTLKIPTGVTGGSDDVGGYVVDPANFSHILLSLHYTPDEQFGFLESTDAGVTWVVHPYPTTVPGGTKGIFFLHAPEYGIGNESTWLMTTEQAGFWRTSNAGATWTNVAPTFSGVHGGLREHYYSRNGLLYTGGYQYPHRSTDNGITWTAITDKMYGYYGTIGGDGRLVYTIPSGNNTTMMTSPDTSGLSWTAQSTFALGVGLLRFDAANNIMYATTFAANGGVWALKTQASTETKNDFHSRMIQNRLAVNRKIIRITGEQAHLSTSLLASAEAYDITGRHIGQVQPDANGMMKTGSSKIGRQVLIVKQR